MKKHTIKIICITAGAVAAVGSGIAVLACYSAKSKKAKKTVAAVPLNDSWNCK
ncbi:MAG TPA: hypothetical protein PLF24_05345 [Ruminococcus sp.]|nr:hypothetical protein [Ruminococcus sp.]